MHERDASLGRDVREMKSRGGGIDAGAIRATVQDDNERDGGQERRAHDDAAQRNSRGNHGVNHITRRVRDTSRRTLSGRKARVIFTACERETCAGSDCC